ncbi:MAG: c-type cytochrome [Vicinamibacterales bacterium]
MFASGAIPAITILFLTLTFTGAATSRAAAASNQPSLESTGRDLYESACAACHGVDGRGTAPSLLGFDTPIPDFTDCSFSTVEPDADWMAVSHDGGPARAFDRRMPAFGEAMTDAELQQALDYIRAFCTDAAWPRGELNVPRALVTEKAFPENEAVLTTTIGASGQGHVGNEFLYERRLGARSQFEILVPLLVREGADGGWQRGLGDAAVAVKHALYHSFDRGHIFSVAGEVVLPTGKESAGLGTGTTIVEPFVAFGQILPAEGFLQAQAGLELPFDTGRAGREAFWRAALGKGFTEGRFGRSWSPMVELLAARALEDAAATRWDLVPQMQVTLNRRQHIMINVGVRVPLNAREGRNTQVIAYFLWDWFDGGLLEGWR